MGSLFTFPSPPPSLCAAPASQASAVRPAKACRAPRDTSRCPCSSQAFGSHHLPLAKSGAVEGILSALLLLHGLAFSDIHSSRGFSSLPQLLLSCLAMPRKGPTETAGPMGESGWGDMHAVPALSQDPKPPRAPPRGSKFINI